MTKERIVLLRKTRTMICEYMMILGILLILIIFHRNKWNYKFFMKYIMRIISKNLFLTKIQCSKCFTCILVYFIARGVAVCPALPELATAGPLLLRRGSGGDRSAAWWVRTRPAGRGWHQLRGIQTVPAGACGIN